MPDQPIRMTREDIVEGLRRGHEYEWLFEGIKYYLLPTWSEPEISFQAGTAQAKLYHDVDGIIADGYDLVSMMDNNPDLYEF